MTERIAAIQERISSACARAGREPGSVTLVAVSKTHPPEAIREAANAGLTVFGESRVQEARAKIPLCPSGISWHLVGHLQSNKVKHAVQLFEVIHSVDSFRLLEAVDRACDEAGRRMDVLLEVNVSGEAVKFGLGPEAVPDVLKRANELMRVNVAGLMTMPPFAEDAEKARPHFRRLRELRDKWRAESGFALDQLSMGMSGDFEVAIEEGATLVRVGTALFGERVKSEVRNGGIAEET